MKRIIWVFAILSLIGCAPNANNIDKNVGLHLLSNYGEDYTFITKTPTPEQIKQTLENLDWINGFHQVVLVVEKDISMEVGGSLNPRDGLSSAYRNVKQNEHRVTREPPTTVSEMEAILLSFHSKNGAWENMFIYE